MVAYFNADLMPNPNKEYVCFIDIMGFQNKMNHSVKQASNFMFKLHSMLLEAWRIKGYDSISVYPIMDGAYITSRKKNELLNLLSLVYNTLIKSLTDTGNYSFWYMVRASIAFGNTIHGRNIPYSACPEFSCRVGYKEQLLVGPAMIDAYSHEKCAAPMGIHICESSSTIFRGINSQWKWYSNSNTKTDPLLLQDFTSKFLEYFTWLNETSTETEYPLDKRKDHARKACEYFGITLPELIA